MLEPPLLEAVRTYVVVELGFTTAEVDPVTSPMLLRVSEVAFEADQDRVLVCPAVMVVGLAENDKIIAEFGCVVACTAEDGPELLPAPS